MKAKIVFGAGNKTHFYLDGKEVTREEFDAHVPNRIEDLVSAPMLANNSPQCWPQVSTGAGVHPKQIGQMQDHLKAKGVKGVTFTRDGSAVFADRAARRDYLKATGLHDNHGGYGD